MIRHATMQDIQAIYELLGQFGTEGLMIPRPLSQLYDHVRDFVVHVSPETGTVAGCCALQFCWEDMAEIRSLAVASPLQGRGVGRMLVEAMVAEARSFGVTKLFTLTYQPDFFLKMGFDPIERKDLPLKIWSDCIHCVKFPNCDENAMMRQLSY